MYTICFPFLLKQKYYHPLDVFIKPNIPTKKKKNYERSSEIPMFRSSIYTSDGVISQIIIANYSKIKEEDLGCLLSSHFMSLFLYVFITKIFDPKRWWRYTIKELSWKWLPPVFCYVCEYRGSSRWSGVLIFNRILENLKKTFVPHGL